MSTRKTSLTKRETPVLHLLREHSRPDGEWCVSFSTLSGEPRNSERTCEVRRIVRQLARKGLAEYHRGLFTDDGMICGSGYCVTRAGLTALAEREQPDGL